MPTNPVGNESSTDDRPIAPNLEKRLLSSAELAALLSVSERHMRRMWEAGRMPLPIKLGGALRWDSVVISRWIDEGCPQHSARRHRK